ncbi:hydrogenase nickel incorporation protein HypA [Thermococcus sp.]|uniref:hydrogenase nickel incorporation protein HypA n=1 Tax=Thermococcus sp. TaxID=35749 RepID=UPI0026208652|nr:hydrogenase nickel incorporation protein HypA [Thermococcus sp.]
MHEWALADAIVRTVLDYANREGAKRVKAVKVVLGELQDVDEEIVKFAMEQLFSGTIAEGAKIEFIGEEAVFRCRNCGYEWKLREVKNRFDERLREDMHFIPEVVHAFLACPKCGSHDFEIVKGRGVYVAGIMIEKGGDA